MTRAPRERPSTGLPAVSPIMTSPRFARVTLAGKHNCGVTVERHPDPLADHDGSIGVTRRVDHRGLPDLTAVEPHLVDRHVAQIADLPNCADKQVLGGLTRRVGRDAE